MTDTMEEDSYKSSCAYFVVKELEVRSTLVISEAGKNSEVRYAVGRKTLFKQLKCGQNRSRLLGNTTKYLKSETSCGYQKFAAAATARLKGTSDCLAVFQLRKQLLISASNDVKTHDTR